MIEVTLERAKSEAEIHMITTLEDKRLTEFKNKQSDSKAVQSSFEFRHAANTQITARRPRKRRTTGSTDRCLQSAGVFRDPLLLAKSGAIGRIAMNAFYPDIAPVMEALERSTELIDAPGEYSVSHETWN